MVKRTLGPLVLAVAALLIVVSCSGRAPAEAAPRSGKIRTSTHSLLSGLSIIRYELGHIYVPENRARADSRLSAVRYMRIKGTPPVFMLSGGPRDSYIDAFTKSGLDWFGAARQRRRRPAVSTRRRCGDDGPTGRVRPLGAAGLQLQSRWTASGSTGASGR